jgi:hypothetical protein
VFIREQREFETVLRSSRLPLLALDISSGDVAGAADRVADWLERTGGLTLA